MATTLRFCDGAESKNLSWAVDTTGTTTNLNSTTAPRTGTQCYRAVTADSVSFRLPVNPDGLLSGGTSTTDDHVIVGFAFKRSVVGVGTNIFFGVRESGSSTVMASLRIQADADIQFFDTVGALLTITDPFTDEQWHYVEVYFEHIGSNGNWEVIIDGVSKGSGSTGDFLTTGNDLDKIHFSSALGTYSYDDIYCLTDDTSKPAFLGSAEVFAFQGGAGATTTGSVDDPPSVPEENLADLPFNASGDDIELNSSNSEFSMETDAGAFVENGPRSNANIDGDSNIKMAVWNHRLLRTNGSSGATLDQSYGNDTDTLQYVNRESELTVSYQEFFVSSEDQATAVPLSTEDFEYGIRKNGTTGRDIWCAGIFAQLLHVPSAAGTDPVSDNLFINRAVQRAANF